MLNWTTEQKLQHLLGLPWTVRVTSEDGDLVGRVAELRGVLAYGSDERAMQRDLYESIAGVLEAMLEHGDPIMPPPDTTLPWDSEQVAPTGPSTFVLAPINDAFDSIRLRMSATSRVERVQAQLA